MYKKNTPKVTCLPLIRLRKRYIWNESCCHKHLYICQDKKKVTREGHVGTVVILYACQYTPLYVSSFKKNITKNVRHVSSRLRKCYKRVDAITLWLTRSTTLTIKSNTPSRRPLMAKCNLFSLIDTIEIIPFLFPKIKNYIYFINYLLGGNI